ncbi:MAG: hypothetical protein IJA19_04045 [Clostridia bacterium]|nr:hypothetical protein [Clostridia bacterium]MBQ4543322.1 hypothetical protein [Clostridia bacterium]MBQ9997782.1 hypothetical protein [Clostridia bacterium]
MYYPTTGTSAYKPEMVSPTRKTKKKAVKKKSKNDFKLIVYTALIFMFMFITISRSVFIYGQHAEIEHKTAQLNTLKMENEQMSVDIKAQTDSSIMEQYAMTHLNLKKMDTNQIVYLNQTTDDSMTKIAHNEKDIFGGLFGLFSGALEYLK